MRRLLNNPIINSILKALVMQFIMWGSNLIVKSPQIEFIKPELIEQKKYIICMKKPPNTKAFEDTRIILEFSEGISCETTAIKVTRDQKVNKLICSINKGNYISFDTIEVSGSKNEKILLMSDEIIKIQLTLNKKIEDFPLVNIYINHKDGLYTLKDFLLITKIKKYVNWKVFLCISILILLFVYPYARRIKKKQKELLKRCQVNKIKSMTKFAKKYNKAIFAVIRENPWGLDILEIRNEKSWHKAKAGLTKLIARKNIFPKWNTLPRICKSLESSIKEAALDYLADRWAFGELKSKESE